MKKFLKDNFYAVVAVPRADGDVCQVLSQVFTDEAKKKNVAVVFGQRWNHIKEANFFLTPKEVKTDVMQNIIDAVSEKTGSDIFIAKFQDAASMPFVFYTQGDIAPAIRKEAVLKAAI